MHFILPYSVLPYPTLPSCVLGGVGRQGVGCAGPWASVPLIYQRSVYGDGVMSALHGRCVHMHAASPFSAFYSTAVPCFFQSFLPFSTVYPIYLLLALALALAPALQAGSR